MGSASVTNLNATNFYGSSSVYASNITANNTLNTNTLNVTGAANFNTISTSGQLSIGGNFVLQGSTVYNSNNFTINSGSSVASNGYFSVYRGSSGNAATILWNENIQAWQIQDVNSGNLNNIIVGSSSALTDNLVSTSITTAPTANTVNALNNLIAFVAGVDARQNVSIQAAFNKANTSVYNGTTGQAIASNGVISFSSNNGVVISGAGNTVYVSTSQDLRTSASPTFNALTLTNPLPISSGGTGGASATSALTNLLPSGYTAGYVLTTNGPGSYYWAAGGGGGGGATPGTSINSSALSYSANGSGLSYTTPTYLPGADQLRVYVSGIRQLPTAYTETSNTIVTFNTSPPSGASIYLEVDGYVATPYYANNIAYSVNALISPTANTIQLAIDGLTTVVNNNFANTLASSITFSGTVSAVQFNATSDLALKDNITTITNALDKVEALRGVNFTWKSNGLNSIGLIAQETEKVLPEVVTPIDGYKNINYDGIIGVLVEAIKELKQEIDNLKNR